ncbi:MAG TPA: hypothetical protein VFY76_03140 [Nocardioides sp.]|nr:hypothetical protein [Nocardioides sp.]
MTVVRRLGLWLCCTAVSVTVSDAGRAELSGASHAHRASCQGEPATIVGVPGQRELVGTPGPDVIVSGGARVVAASAGDDRICVTGRASFVDAGEGNDVVHTSDSNMGTAVALGPGADYFSGGSRPDSVSAGDGTDVVSTGTGRDSYEDGSLSGPNDDVIDLGPGRDQASVGAQPLMGTLHGGAGRDLLNPRFGGEDSSGEALVDNRTQIATFNGQTWLRWSSFEGFGFGAFLPSVATTFIGSDADERVLASQEFEFGPDIELLSTGAGDDRVTLSGMAAPLDAGLGHDRLEVVGFADERSLTPAREIAIDLKDQTMRVDDGVRQRFAVRGVEDLEVDGFGTAFLSGTGDDNDMVVGNTCFSLMAGRGGADTLGGRVGDRCTPRMAAYFGVPNRVQADGGRGQDGLFGRGTNDVLVGGRGLDDAVGRGGFDRCSTERRASCEA